MLTKDCFRNSHKCMFWVQRTCKEPRCLQSYPSYKKQLEKLHQRKVWTSEPCTAKENQHLGILRDSEIQKVPAGLCIPGSKASAVRSWQEEFSISGMPCFRLRVAQHVLSTSWALHSEGACTYSQVSSAELSYRCKALSRTTCFCGSEERRVIIATQ